jgi:hypothetical protein
MVRAFVMKVNKSCVERVVEISVHEPSSNVT